MVHTKQMQIGGNSKVALLCAQVLNPTEQRWCCCCCGGKRNWDGAGILPTVSSSPSGKLERTPRRLVGECGKVSL